MLAFIQWAPDPTVFTIGNYSIRWYALCWCCALLLAYWNMHRLYRDQRIPEEKFEPLFSIASFSCCWAPVWATACSTSRCFT